MMDLIVKQKNVIRVMEFFNSPNRRHISMNSLRSKLGINPLTVKICDCITGISVKPLQYASKEFSTDKSLQSAKVDSTMNKEESLRMKQFHKKLKLQPIPNVPPGERFMDLVLVETDPATGELLTNAEIDPTRWGDWQTGGRVSDF